MGVPGDAACRPIGDCGSGTWGNIAVDANTVYVDGAHTVGDGDGSAAKYLEIDVGLLGDLVWFFAHEMTHLHQFVDHGDDARSWMIEGFADTMATHLLVRIGLWNDAALERRYWSVAPECARELSKGPLAAARGRVAYVCGDLVGVALMVCFLITTSRGCGERCGAAPTRV